MHPQFQIKSTPGLDVIGQELDRQIQINNQQLNYIQELELKIKDLELKLKSYENSASGTNN